MILIKRLQTGKLYPNPGHRDRSVWNKPSLVCQHLGSIRSQLKNLLDWIWTWLEGSGLDWSIAGLVERYRIASSAVFSLLGIVVFPACICRMAVNFAIGALTLLPIFVAISAFNAFSVPSGSTMSTASTASTTDSALALAMVATTLGGKSSPWRGVLRKSSWDLGDGW